MSIRKQVIIFGATGNVGMYVIDYCFEHLDKREFDLIAVGRKEKQFFSENNIKFISVDISKNSDFEKLPKDNVFAVVFMAAQLPTHESFVQPERFVMTNILGCLNILEYCRKVKAEKIIYTHTMSNIAATFGKEPVIKPRIPKNFSYRGDHSMYVISKNTGEELIEHYYQEFGLKKFVLHLPTVYQYRRNRFWYVNGVKKFRTFHRFIDLAIDGEPLEMWGNPNSYRDMVYVKDFGQLVHLSILSNRDEGYYNVGTGIPTTLKEILEGIVNVFSPKERLSQIIAMPEKSNTPSYVLDIQNARDELGYEPKYTYRDLLLDYKKTMELDKY